MEILRNISLVIGSAGVVIIVWGAILAFLSFLQLEYYHIKGNHIVKKREFLRHHFGSYILIGLEFMIAADIIFTIIHPDLQRLLTLGIIVVIRTIISFFLNYELKEAYVREVRDEDELEKQIQNK
jgi:uncharacterized membrane protein